MLDRIEFDKNTQNAFREQFEQLRELLADYIEVNEKVKDLPVAPEEDKEAVKRIAETDIPAKGRNGVEVGKQLISDVFQNGMMIQHPRFFSFVASSVSPYSLAGAILSEIYNLHGGAWALAPGASMVEEKLVKWMGSLAGFPEETCGGIFMSGGSLSTMSALIAARENKLTHEEITIATAYFSDQTHSSVEKAFRMLGFSPEQIVKIPTDDNFKIRPELLEEAIEKDIAAGKKPFAVIGNLGTTNTGTIDPLDKIADAAEKYNLWMHVDGAYGGSSLISPIYRNLAKGIERADSVTWDTHKWMMQTYSCSTLIVRDEQTLLNAFTEHPEYLEDVRSSEHYDGWDMGPEMSRPHRAIKLWYTVQALGTDLLEEIIEYSFYNAKIVENMLRQFGDWEIVSEPSCGTINFRFHPEGFTEEELNELSGKISEELNKTGYAFVVTTTLRGKRVLRMCMINSNTTEEDVRSTVELLDKIARELTEKR